MRPDGYSLFTVLLVLATAQPALAQDASWLDSLIKSLPTYQRHMADSPGDSELQVLYRALDGPESNVTFTHGVAPNRYFYPASTVKLPMAALALQAVMACGGVGLPGEVGLRRW